MRIDAGGTIWQVSYFKRASVGDLFWCNGNKWRKRSNKTAEIVWPESYAGKWFYFRQSDVCETIHSKQEKD